MRCGTGSFLAHHSRHHFSLVCHFPSRQQRRLNLFTPLARNMPTPPFFIGRSRVHFQEPSPYPVRANTQCCSKLLCCKQFLSHRFCLPFNQLLFPLPLYHYSLFLSSGFPVCGSATSREELFIKPPRLLKPVPGISESLFDHALPSPLPQHLIDVSHRSKQLTHKNNLFAPGLPKPLTTHNLSGQISTVNTPERDTFRWKVQCHLVEREDEMCDNPGLLLILATISISFPVFLPLRSQHGHCSFHVYLTPVAVA